ncbi:hypothetical protein NR798_33565 [Archangium gephyra]|uniref:hypothetical protein n=1 Tax=Archangium gephyra TaxID=48 RepID=UPI0035D46F10
MTILTIAPKPPPPPKPNEPSVPSVPRLVSPGSHNTYWMESGSVPGTLSGSVPVQWGDSSPGLIVNAPPTGQASEWTFTGRGFGKTTITASAPGYEPVSLELYIGSVVIVGSDHMYWRVYSYGEAKKMDPGELKGDVGILIKNNAIVADLTMASTPTAVTCYLLNLQSFRPKSKPQ